MKTTKFKFIMSCLLTLCFVSGCGKNNESNSISSESNLSYSESETISNSDSEVVSVPKPSSVEKQKENAKIQLKDYITDTSLYSEDNIIVINNLINEGSKEIDKATKSSEVINILYKYLKDLNEVSTMKQEIAYEFINQCNQVTTSNYGYEQKTLIANKDGSITQNNYENWTEYYFGNQSNNPYVAFDTYITIDYENVAYSSLSFKFRKWDSNSTYKIRVTRNEMIMTKLRWSSTSGGVETTTIQQNAGIKDKTRVHLQMLACEDKKVILIDGVNVLEVEENDLTVGYTGIETWQTKYTLDNYSYTEFETKEAFLEKYSKEIYSNNIFTIRTKSINEINGRIESYNLNPEYNSLLKELVADDIKAIESKETKEEVEEVLANALLKLEKKYDELVVGVNLSQKTIEEVIALGDNTLYYNSSDKVVVSKAVFKGNTYEINYVAQEDAKGNDFALYLKDNSLISGLKYILSFDIEVEQSATIVVNNVEKTIDQGSNEISITYTESDLLPSLSILFGTENSIENLGTVKIKNLSITVDKISANYIHHSSILAEQVKFISKPENVSVSEETGKIEVSGGKGVNNELQFLDKSGNTHAAMRFDITPSYLNTKYSAFSIYFRWWNHNLSYKLVVYDNSIQVLKNNGEGNEPTVISSYDYGFANNETTSVIIICSEWTKQVFVNGELIADIFEGSYTVGSFYINSWEVPYTLDNVYVSNYSTREELLVDFPEFGG